MVMHGLILRVTIPLGICLPHPGHTEKGNAPPLGSHGQSRLFVVSEEDFTTHPIQMTEYSDLAHNLFLKFLLRYPLLEVEIQYIFSENFILNLQILCCWFVFLVTGLMRECTTTHKNPVPTKAPKDFLTIKDRLVSFRTQQKCVFVAKRILRI